MKMKALSIKQPWVHAILHLGKDVENRTWTTKHEGWIALHASAKPDKDAKFPRGLRPPDLGPDEYSAILGVARLVRVVEKSRSKWFHRPINGKKNFGWILEDVIALEKPVRCKGNRSLWKVPAAEVRKIRRQLPGIDFADGTTR